MKEAIIWFSVHIQARAPAGERTSEVDDASVDVFMDLLKAYDGVVGNSHRSWTATVSIEMPDPLSRGRSCRPADRVAGCHRRDACLADGAR